MADCKTIYLVLHPPARTPLLIGQGKKTNVRFLNSEHLVSAPQPPQNLTVVEARATEVDLNWDDHADTDTFTVYVKNVTTGLTEQTITGVVTSQVTVTGLTEETDYEFWVTAVRDDIESGESNHVFVITPAPPNFITTDFSEYVLDQPPNNWTELWHTSPSFIVKDSPSVIGGKSLVEDNSEPGTLIGTFLSLDDIVELSDIETLTLMRVQGSPTNQQGYPVLRGAGNDTGYIAYLDVFQARFSLRKVVNGSNSQLDFITGAWAMNTWFWIRFSAIGDQIKAKIWEKGTSEPGWQLTSVDNEILSGKVGVGYYYSTGTKIVDYFAVSKDGTTIPVP